MTSLKGDLRSIMGTPFGGVGHAVLIFSRVTRAAFNSDSVILQLHDRIEMPEEADGKFQVDGLDPGPIRIELEGGTVHNHGWNIDLPDEGVWSLTDLVDAQVDWSPAVIGRAEAAAREAREHADRAEAGADRVGTAEQVGVWASEASASASSAASAESGAIEARDASQSARDAAEGHANRAASSASSAAASETNAKQSENNAGDYAAVATTAATEAVDAMESVSDAVSSIGDSVNTAAGHAYRASQSESGAAAYAQNAADAADRVGTAEQVGTWAQQAQDAADRIGTAETVEGWVDDARSSASSASLSEAKAKEHRDAAASAASSTADELRGELINIAGDASSHATDASRSAARAKTSETNAATHEANSLSAAERAEFAAEETIQQVEGDFATRNYVDSTIANALRVDTSVGTRVFAGNMMIHGDTGLRRINDLATGLDFTTSTLYKAVIYRVGYEVHLSAIGLSLGIQNITEGLPYGFRPIAGTYHSNLGSMYQSGQILSVGNPSSTNRISVVTAPRSGVGVALRVSWRTADPWPTTLPGIPD